jgi:hypothetical protein
MYYKQTAMRKTKSEYNKTWDDKNRDKKQTIAQKWYSIPENKEKAKAVAKAQYWADPEAAKKRTIAYQKAHKARVAENAKIRRERKKNEDTEAYKKLMSERNARYRAKVRKEKGLPEIKPQNPNPNPNVTPKPVHVRMTEEERQLSILARLESLKEVIKTLRS